MINLFKDINKLNHLDRMVVVYHSRFLVLLYLKLLMVFEPAGRGMSVANDVGLAPTLVKETKDGSVFIRFLLIAKLFFQLKYDINN